MTLSTNESRASTFLPMRTENTASDMTIIIMTITVVRRSGTRETSETVTESVMALLSPTTWSSTRPSCIPTLANLQDSLELRLTNRAMDRVRKNRRNTKNQRNQRNIKSPKLKVMVTIKCLPASWRLLGFPIIAKISDLNSLFQKTPPNRHLLRTSALVIYQDQYWHFLLENSVKYIKYSFLAVARLCRLILSVINELKIIIISQC